MSQTLTQQLAQAQTHFRGGNIGAAETLLREVVAADPQNATAAEYLAYIAGNRGDLQRSFELLKIATAAPGASGEAHYYLGKHYLERALFAQAAAAFRQSLQRIGDYFEGLHDLGVALSGLGEPTAALDTYQRALALNPNSDQLYYNRGVALDALKQFDAALESYERAVALNPNLAVAWYNRGATLDDVGRFEAALASHEKAIALNPEYAQAWSNRGVTLATLKRYREALENQQKALSINPDLAEAWARAGAVLRELKNHDQAYTHLEKALALKPDVPYLMGDWLHTKMLLCQWQGGNIEQDYVRVLAGIDADRSVLTPFASLSIPATRAQQRLCAAHFVRDRYFAPLTKFPAATHDPRAKIRLGYFSPDFRSHAVSYLTAGLLEHHDRTRFEVHAFAMGESGDDPMTVRLKSAVDHFHDVGRLSDQQFAEKAHAQGIDIAIDLTGHTQGARTGIFARRAAPLQVNYLGYPGTMGAPFIDYIIADEIVVPASHRADYAEKIVFMPHCFQVNDAKRIIAASPSRAQYHLEASAFVYCCFNNAYKINPAIFDIWLNLLQRTAHGVLWLIGESDSQIRNLKQWAAARGVSADKLVFAGRLPYADHLARYPLADLVLDTLPFNGGTTTSDALWGGAPVLTCAGDTFAGRMASSLLTAIGLPELITHTLHDYQEKALHLAHNPQMMAQLKQTLAANRSRYPLFDTRLFTHHIEQAFENMWQRYQAGATPDHLWITDTEACSAEGLNA